MFLLGHIGISLGIIIGLVWLIAHSKKSEKGAVSSMNIDFRIVIIAAMLPDIIDKIVGLVILKDELSNGRIFTHSILVVGTISLYIVGIGRVRTGHIVRHIIHAAPAWLHLLLDRMWEQPETLLWPLFGTRFPRIDIEIADYFSILLSDMYTLSGEIVGGILIIILITRHRLYNFKNLRDFIKSGRLAAVQNTNKLPREQ